MRFLKRRRGIGYIDQPLEDPISGVANLFDASVVFIVSMMIATSEVTIIKKTADGKIEIMTKKGREIKARKVTDKKLSGEGTRLGTAYELKDGRIVYVPE